MCLCCFGGQTHSIFTCVPIPTHKHENLKIGQYKPGLKIKNLPSFKQIIMTNQSKEQPFFSNGSFEEHCIMYIFIQTEVQTHFHALLEGWTLLALPTKARILCLDSL
jgi:hypothetical protein